MTFTANNGCTFCGSDAHMTAVCPMRGDACEVCHGDGCFPFDSPCVECNGAGIQKASAAQSAPDEREAFEAWYVTPEAFKAGDSNGWHGIAWAAWQQCAARQRAQSAPVVPEGELPWTGEQLARAWYLAEYGPGHDLAPGYAVAFARELAAMLAAAPQPACATCNDNGRIGGPSFYAPDEGGEPCPDCAQPAACTNEDSWNCKYCRKTETCAALQDKRNFGAPQKAAPQEPLHITHRPLIRNAISLLSMRRPMAPDVERVVTGLSAMLDGLPTPAGAASAAWLQVAEMAETPAARQEQGDEVRRLRELLREADDWVRVLRTQFGYAQTKNLAERIDAALSASAEGKA